MSHTYIICTVLITDHDYSGRRSNRTLDTAIVIYGSFLFREKFISASPSQGQTLNPKNSGNADRLIWKMHEYVCKCCKNANTWNILA